MERPVMTEEDIKCLREEFGETTSFCRQAKQNVNMLLDEIERLYAYKKYWDELYGRGLEIANWHLNGELEPYDTFYDSAEEYHRNEPIQ